MLDVYILGTILIFLGMGAVVLLDSIINWASKDPHNDDPGYLAFCWRILPPEDYERLRRDPEVFRMYQACREALQPRVK